MWLTGTTCKDSESKVDSNKWSLHNFGVSTLSHELKQKWIRRKRDHYDGGSQGSKSGFQGSEIIMMEVSWLEGGSTSDLRVIINYLSICLFQILNKSREKLRQWQLTGVIAQHNLMFFPFHFFKNLRLKKLLRKSYCARITAMK